MGNYSWHTLEFGVSASLGTGPLSENRTSFIKN